MLEPLAIWLSQHTGIVAIIGTISFLLLVTSVLAAPWILAKLPANYFSTPQAIGPGTIRSVLVSTIRTMLGIIVIITGIVMMVTPGPGLVCLVLGMVLCEFPGKHRLLRNIIRRPSVLSTLNWLRRKADKPPFESPSSD